MTYQLVVVQLWALLVRGEPPGGSTDGGGADITADSHVTEEEPAADEGLSRATRRLLHDVQIGWVEAEGGGGQAIRDQVNPEQLYGDQGLGHSQGSRQEDTYNLQTMRFSFIKYNRKKVQ